jgi:hypothetical protein
MLNMDILPMNMNDWANKRGTSMRTCSCGTWLDHWMNFSEEAWPARCSVYGCSNEPTLGAHIYHLEVSGEMIVPMCISCNNNQEFFDLKSEVVLVPANRSSTCG